MLKIIRWILGISWLLAGFAKTGDAAFGGLLLSFAGLLTLPPVFPYLANATGKTLSRPLKYVAVIVLLVASAAVQLPQQETQTDAKKKLAETQAAEKKHQEALAYTRLTPTQKDSIAKALEKEK